MSEIYATRYHDISCGHRVVGHESKCKWLHGHNYRIHFQIKAKDAAWTLDELGRVIDFGVIKSIMCEWLEVNWDHKFLMWEDDPLFHQSLTLQNKETGVILVPFNPTAENMAIHLLEIIGPQLLPENVVLTSVIIEETRKCSAEAKL
jgi:6-pyruvoyltetrahydropterin/6-carboxytetrahydropterin synthase